MSIDTSHNNEQPTNQPTERSTSMPSLSERGMSPRDAAINILGATAIAAAGVASRVEPISAQQAATDGMDKSSAHTLVIQGGIPSQQAFDAFIAPRLNTGADQGQTPASVVAPIGEQQVNPEQQKVPSRIKTLQSIQAGDTIWELKENMDDKTKFVSKLILKVTNGEPTVESQVVVANGIDEPTAVGVYGSTVVIGGNNGKIAVSTDGGLTISSTKPPIDVDTGKKIGYVQVLEEGKIVMRVQSRTSQSDYYNELMNIDGSNKINLGKTTYLDGSTTQFRLRGGSYIAYEQFGAGFGYNKKQIVNGQLTSEFVSTPNFKITGGVYEYERPNGDSVLLLRGQNSKSSIIAEIVNDNKDNLKKIYELTDSDLPDDIVKKNDLDYQYVLHVSGIYVNPVTDVKYLGIVVAELRPDEEGNFYYTKDTGIVFKDKTPYTRQGFPSFYSQSGLGVSPVILMEKDGVQVVEVNFFNTTLPEDQGAYYIKSMPGASGAWKRPVEQNPQQNKSATYIPNVFTG